jgi:hypothetical protein
MKKDKLREIIQETLFEALTEALCAKGKAYVAKRKRAGEKHGAYLMGRAVKVCKGQIKGEDVDEAMYGTATHDAPKKKVKKEDIDAKDNTEFKITLKHLLDKHVSKGGEKKDD